MMSNWINELDRLPPPYEKVLCYGLLVDCLATRPYVDFAYRDDHGWWQLYAGTDADGWQITHWMEIPEPPIYD